MAMPQAAMSRPEMTKGHLSLEGSPAPSIIWQLNTIFSEKCEISIRVAQLRQRLSKTIELKGRAFLKRLCS